MNNYLQKKVMTATISKRIILIFILFLGFQTNIFAQTPKEYLIADITVTGIEGEGTDPNVIKSIAGLQNGDKIRVPGDRIANAIKNLWNLGIFGDVQVSITEIQGESIYLNIFIKERARLSRFKFSGIRKGEARNLTEKLKDIRGNMITDVLKKNAKLTVEKYYHNKGFLNVDIKVIEEDDPIVKGKQLLNIQVNKNKKTKIEKIHIVNNNVFSDKKIKKRLKKTVERKSFRLFKTSKFIDSRYEEDKERLITFLNAKGYRDARIISDSVYAVGNDRVAIDIVLEEGIQYYYGNITWKGNYIYEDNFLSKVLGIKRGDIYDLEYLDTKLNFSQKEQDISSLYMDIGYLFFRIEPIEKAIRGDTIDVELRISEGPQTEISKIIIEGNTKTSDHVILRQLRTIPGRKFSRSDLIRSQQELAALGYFDPEQMDIQPIPHLEDGTVDILYKVTEKPSDQIELSGGWGGAFGFVGTVGLVFNNFSARKIGKFREWRPLPSGDGQSVSLRAQANGRQFQTYSLSFSEPWLGGRKPNSFSLSFQHSIQRSIFRGEVLGSFKLYGVTVGLGRRLTWPDDYFTLTNSLSYFLYDLENFQSSLGFSDGQAQNINFNTTLSRNSIDNPTFPRNGATMSLSLSLTPPYSFLGGRDEVLANRLVEYHKWMFDSAWYTTLFGTKFVLSTRAHFGYLGAYDPIPGVSVGPFERFQLGGDGLAGFNFLLGTEIIGLRGYNNNSIVPVGAPQGGVVYNKFVMEFRYPVSLNPAATIYIQAFMEGGNNWATTQEVNPFNLQRSAGIGARIFMPAFGMLGLDWGYGFDPVPGRPGANEGQFHFTIGQQIR